jgi:PAS domain S-box-containing protein
MFFQESRIPACALALSLILLIAGSALCDEPPVSTIRAAVLTDFPPLYQLDKDGNPDGFAIDVLTYVAREAGVDVQYVKAENWAEAMQLLRDNKADLIPGIGISPARKREFVFTSEMESVPVNCFVRAQDEHVKQVEDLAQHRTAVIRQSAAHTGLIKHPEIPLVSFSTIEGALFALLSGEVDALVFPGPVLEKKARQIGVDDRIKKVGKPLIDLKRGFMMPRHRAKLASFLNPTIRKLIKSPEYQEIYLKWYGKPESFWSARRIFYLMALLLSVSVIALVLWRSMSLTRMNLRLAEHVARLQASEKALTDQREYLRTLQSNLPDAMFLCDPRGRFLDVNVRACEALGYSREELLQMTAVDVDTGFEAPEQVQDMWGQMVPGEPVHYVGTHRRKDGSTFPVEINACRYDMNGESHVIGNARNISERVRLEEEVRQSHKMNAIGELAGGVAHDFNNILAGIMGFSELLMDEIPKGSRAETHLNFILQASERARSLIRQILTFSRRETERMGPVSLHDIVDEVLALLRASLPSSIQIETVVDTQAPTVMADSGKIHEALMNLATNAVYAMKSKGQLTVSLHREETKAPVQGVHGWVEPGVWSVISVRDTGEGMTDDTIAKMFEPFFTTKPAGEGTGMGLSVVYGIMHSHGGDIVVESTPGEGSTFSLFFPASRQPDSVPADPVNCESGGNERILFVDDEEMLVEMGEHMVSSLGYHVTTTTDANVALQIFTASPCEFDLLITDQTMPKLTGTELITRIRKVRPDFPVILCTGYSGSLNETDSSELAINAFVAKPYRKRDMGDAIRRIFDECNRVT